MSTQLDCSIGVSPAESSYGTITTPTKFVEFTDESLDWDPTFPEGMGLRAGSRITRASRTSSTPIKQQVTGDFTVPATSKTMGWMFKAALGAVTTTQRGVTGVFQQNHTMVTTDFLESYTIQKGLPLLGGATQAHTFAGMMCSSLEIACPNADIATIKPTWNGQKVDTATGYASPSYATPVELLHFGGGAITIGGSPSAPTTTALATGGTSVANIRDFTITIDNGLDDAGFNFSSAAAGKRSRNPAVGRAPITGQLTAEFDVATYRDAYLSQTNLALVFTLTGFTVIGSGSDVPALSVYCPLIRLRGELPKAAGGAVITQTMPFQVFDNESVTPITVSYVSLDTTP